VAGLTAGRARGRVGGRPSKLSAEQVRQVSQMYDARELTVEQIGAVLGVSRTTIYWALGKTTTPAPPATATPASARQAEPVAAAKETATQGTAGGAAATGSAWRLSLRHRQAGRRWRCAREAGRAGSWWRPTRPIPSTGRWRCLMATPAGRGDRRIGPGQAQGVGRRGGVGGAAGPRRRPDQLQAGVGQPGQAGVRAPGAAAVTGRLCGT